MGESLVHCARLWLTLVPLEICLKLLLGSLAVEQEFLPRTERQAANIAVGDARRGSNESDDLKISNCHGWHCTGLSLPAVINQRQR